MVGIGLAWASIMGNPYILLAGSIPPERAGVYMGIFNMFIVIPMLIQMLTLPLYLRRAARRPARQRHPPGRRAAGLRRGGRAVRATAVRASMKNQVQLITYVDRLGGGDLHALHALLDGPLQGVFGGVHLLPFFHAIDGADAGFDPIDHTQVDPRLGDWADIRAPGRRPWT